MLKSSTVYGRSRTFYWGLSLVRCVQCLDGDTLRWCSRTKGHKMSKLSLHEQWNRLVETMSKRVIGADSRAFTRDLYETLHTRCNMIAHFNKEGFIKARFWTLADFDQTLSSMRTSMTGRLMLEQSDTDKLAMARFRIAQAESARLNQQVRVMQDHAKRLQAQFTKQF